MLLAIALGAGISGAGAQAPLAPPWAFSRRALPVIHLPPSVRTVLETHAEQLGVSRQVMDGMLGDSTAFRGLIATLGADGDPDYILTASSLCGSGGCEFLLIDPRHLRLLGTVLGATIYVRVQCARGYPELDAYTNLSADSGYWTRSVFGGVSYGDSTASLGGVAGLRHVLAGAPLVADGEAGSASRPVGSGCGRVPEARTR